MSKNKKHLRWFSITNPWMDFVVTVDERDAKRATGIIQDALENWWEEDYGMGYGEAVECALDDAGITYETMYHDDNDESEEYEERWEASLPKGWVSIA